MSNENSRDKQFNPLTSPDAARKVFQLLNRFYDGYTKRNNGFTDTNGLKYAGTFENFGSEIFIEARKMLMDKPPIDMVFTRNDFDFYFDLMYSELIETYEQQTMFVGVLKNNVLRSDCTYQLIYNDCRKEHVLRSESWSDPDVYRDNFIVTSTPPTISIVDSDGNNTEVSMKISSTLEGNIKYYFHIDKTNERLYKYNEETQTLVVNISKREVNIPLIWIYCDDFKTLPDIGFVGNSDMNGNTLLTVGTDGHGVSHLYPLVYSNNYPEEVEQDSHKSWYLKVQSIDEASFNDVDNPMLYDVTIQSISYIYSINPWTQPDVEKTITFTDEFVKITLDPSVHWLYHKPRPGEYDYDGVRYINKRYAYTPLNQFESNNSNGPLTPVFKITFLRDYLHKFERYMDNSVSGISMDTCSDRSDNGTLKKYGTIHSLGEFDGLPMYFKLLGDKTDHRSHVELYAIRDRLNKVNQKATDKQTAAIIIDSALSPKESEELLNSLPIMIKYNMDVGRLYEPVSDDTPASNVKSSITFIDENTFGDDAIVGQTLLPHFIYQGSRVYALNSFKLDPDLEYGRVYIISNDPSEYENNTKTKYPKALRTFARICDIPTIFSQLIHITGYVPTVIMDPEYVHCDAAFMNDDNERLWNVLHNPWVTVGHTAIDGYNNQTATSIGIFSYGNNLDLVFRPVIYTGSKYTKKTNLNPIVYFGTINVVISTPGSQYAKGDRFTFYVGGRLITGTVTNASLGRVTAIELDVEDSETINIANLDGRITSFETESITGNGNGLIISFEISIDKWNELNEHGTNIPYDDLFTLKYDQYGFLWFWKYDGETEHWSPVSQLTGPTIVENEYDTKYGIDELHTRGLRDVMMYNLLNTYQVPVDQKISEYNETSVIPLTVDIDTVTTFTGPDYQNTLYLLKRYDDPTYSNYQVEYYTSNKKPNRKDLLKLPQYNQVNLDGYFRIGSSLEPVDRLYYQPMMGYYNPNKSTITEWTTIDRTVCDVEERPKTFLDVIDESLITETGHLTDSVFEYNEFNISDEYNEALNQLNALNRSALIQIIKKNFPDAILLQYEGTENAYDEENLITYIMSNFHLDPLYKRRDIHLLRSAGDQVISNKKNPQPIDEQPTGGYEYLVERHHPKATFGKKNYMTTVTHIFKLDEQVDLTDFRMMVQGTDFSKHVLIIMDGGFYIFIDDNWIKIK